MQLMTLQSPSSWHNHLNSDLIDWMSVDVNVPSFIFFNLDQSMSYIRKYWRVVCTYVDSKHCYSVVLFFIVSVGCRVTQHMLKHLHVQDGIPELGDHSGSEWYVFLLQDNSNECINHCAELLYTVEHINVLHGYFVGEIDWQLALIAEIVHHFLIMTFIEMLSNVIDKVGKLK